MSDRSPKSNIDNIVGNILIISSIASLIVFAFVMVFLKIEERKAKDNNKNDESVEISKSINEFKDNKSTTIESQISDNERIEDGEYYFSSKSLREGVNCDNPKGCGNIEMYKKLCEKVSGVTNGLSETWGFSGKGDGSSEFAVLLKNGKIADVSSRWLGPDSFTLSGIRGVCDVAVTVSGIVNGNSVIETGHTNATSFVVNSGEVSVNDGKINVLYFAE